MFKAFRYTLSAAKATMNGKSHGFRLCSDDSVIEYYEKYNPEAYKNIRWLTRNIPDSSGLKAKYDKKTAFYKQHHGN